MPRAHGISRGGKHPKTGRTVDGSVCDRSDILVATDRSKGIATRRLVFQTCSEQSLRKALVDGICEKGFGLIRLH